MNTHEVGTTPRILCDFTDSAGTPYDPITIELKIKSPDGSIVTKAIGDLTQEKTGTWYYPFTVVLTGIHTIRFVGGGPNYDIAAVAYFKGTDVIGS